MRIIMVTVSIWLGTAGFSLAAFEHIETDAFYEREARQQILAEFTQALTMLKKQAEALGMDVRKVDLQRLQTHMYEKAFLMGRCHDEAIEIRNTRDARINIRRHVSACVTMHLKFIDSLRTTRKKSSFHEHEISMCSLKSMKFGRVSPPYDFLGFPQSEMPYRVDDHFELRICYENSSTRMREREHEKFLNSIKR